MDKKVSIIGAGNVGSSLARELFSMGLADIVLLDIVEGLPQGKALDISQCATFNAKAPRIKGTNDYADTAFSDLVVITAGASRRPGMTRDQLLEINAKVVSEATSKVAQHSSDAIIIIVTNPVDVMTYLALKISGFPSKRVFGLSGALDGARFASFISEELNIPAAEIEPCVIGEHGQNMIVIPRLTMVQKNPLPKITDKITIEKLIKLTINGGAEIVAHLKTGSAYYAPAAAAASMVKAVLNDERKLISCAAYLKNDYGMSDIITGVPVLLGRSGIMQTVNIPITSAEQEALEKAVQATRDTIAKLNL